MFGGFLASLFGSLATMFYKKALVANTSGIKPLAFEMIGEIMLVIFCGMLLLLPWFSFEINGPIYHLFFLTFLAKLLSVLANPLYFKAYTHEKISVLMPFTSFDKIFGAVIGYLFLSGNSIWSVVCALGSVVLIIVFNVNAQGIKVSKYCIMLAIAGVFSAVAMALAGFVLQELSSFEFTFLMFGFGFLIMFAYTLMTKQVFELPSQLNRGVVGYRFGDKVFHLSTTILTFFLVATLGLVNTLLLSFIRLVTDLGFSFAVFRDIPRGKDILLSVLVLGLIFIGMILGAD